MADVYFAVTIDVEPDCTPTWHYATPLAFEGVRIGIVEILHPMFRSYGIRPTYLLNNVVIEHQESVDYLKSLKGEYELGTHLHCEFIAPNKIFTEYGGKKGEANQCFLDPQIEYEKINNITKMFTHQFGYKPTSFRAGRFSVGGQTIASLKKLGYTVESSITPGICWNDKTREYPIDFSGAPNQPYYINESNIIINDPTSTFLEVPVTIGYTGRWPRRRLTWLRPHLSDYSKMVNLTRQIFDHCKGDRPIVLNMMFHNVEVLPGKSPYCRNEEECNRYIKSLHRYFEFLSSNNVQSLTLSQIYAKYRQF